MTQTLVGIAGTLLAVMMRFLVDTVYLGAAAYAVNVPAILIATLVGGFNAGLLVLRSLFTRYQVVPVQGRFAFATS